jgi:galactokinase/mevalonate kinase-like predicted kinase
MEIAEQELWDTELPAPEKNLWNAKIFPAIPSPKDFRKWLWMSNPAKATKDQIKSWRNADKYSLAEISQRVDLEAFSIWRQRIREEEILSSLGQIFAPESSFSAADLAHIFDGLGITQRMSWVDNIMREAQKHRGFSRSRIIHTLGSAIKISLGRKKHGWTKSIPFVLANWTDPDEKGRPSKSLNASIPLYTEKWAQKAQDIAFENMSRTIVWSKKSSEKHPRCDIHKDKTVMGCAPARLDLGGGWTDTPPYALERGGCVINAAVDLDGKPPIQVHARLIEKPVIRIISQDHGSEVVVKNLKELLDYGKADSKFGLAKAALVLSGFSPASATWPQGVKTLESMLECFGGGIELSTSAAIPSGSGLGTSSIMGAVLISVINVLIGKQASQRELFNLVLQLEQALTTGGGWQDQIGGTVGGVKLITTEAGLVPDPKIQSIKPDVLDPAANRGQTLLYYTGMRRLAKNILRNIVGHYLDRDRDTVETLRKLHSFPPSLVVAMENGDMQGFGKLIERALQLKKEIDPSSSNPEIEKILEKFKPYRVGATFLGAGGGGFLLVVCKSPEDAAKAKKTLEKNPPNPEARFFDYSINTTGLEVTVR